LTTSHEGWDWFDTVGANPDDVAAAHEADAELARAFGNCFRGNHGGRVLRHLRALTLDRVLGPESPDTLLRYIEGQRQLVAYICALVERASHGPAAAGSSFGGKTCENEMEQP
jgi:hypothetical protein